MSHLNVSDGEGETHSMTHVQVGSYLVPIPLVLDPAEEFLLLWSLQQPTIAKHNIFVCHSSSSLNFEACGQSLTFFQSPCSLNTPGVTGAVIWDSGVILGKFLEHAVDSGMLSFRFKKAVELGSGCGVVGCIAALLGAEVFLTDLSDRLRLLRKNVQTNLSKEVVCGSAVISELEWGREPDYELIEPLPDFVLGSDVIYSEDAVEDVLVTLQQISSYQTTIFLAGELRNDVVLQYFLEIAMKDFLIGHVDQSFWHPNYRSKRVVLFILSKKLQKLQS